MKKIFFFIAVLSSLAAIAQDKKQTKKDIRKQKLNEIIKLEEEGVIGYKKHFAAGFKLTNDGYGGFLEKGFAKSKRWGTLFQLDIAERKHAKEEKISNFGNSPIIYGKINYVYPIKLGIQQQYLLGNKGNKNGVNITANVGGGLNLTLLRSYEIELDKNGQPTWVYYESADSTYFLNAYKDQTAQGATLFKGWNNVKMTPGLYAKASLRFDYAPYNESITALEIGIFADFYGKKIPQMIYQKQKQLFLSPYIALVFGKRK